MKRAGDSVMEKRNCFKEFYFWSLLIAFVIVLFSVGGLMLNTIEQFKYTNSLKEGTATVKKVVIPDTGNTNYIYIKFWAYDVLIDDIKLETTNMYNVGDEITIYFDEENPFDASKIRFSKSNFGSIIGIIFPLFFIGVVGWVVIREVLSVRRYNYLIDNGMPVPAEVVDVVRRVSRGRNSGSRVYYNMICEGYVNGKRQRFIKKRLWSNPTHMVGSTVTVYVDANDTSKYVVGYNEKIKDIIKVPKANDDYERSYNQDYNYHNDHINYNNQVQDNSYNNAELSKQISTSTFANDFDDFMNELDNK